MSIQPSDTGTDYQQRYSPTEENVPVITAEAVAAAHQENLTRMPAVEDGFNLPPIRTNNLSVITSQPTNQNSEEQQRRRAHLDWVSTPRSQPSIFSGSYFLSSVEQLEIQQSVDLNSLLGRVKNGSQYRIRVPGAETVFLAVEESHQYQRTLLRSSRQLTLNIMDPSGETAFIIHKSLGWGCMPGCLHRVSVESTDYLGSVEQYFTLVGISFCVYDHARKPICYVEGPNIYSCCISNETQFQILSLDRSRQIASLTHYWNQLLVDYSLLLTFPPETNLKLKGLLLGAAFLLEPSICNIQIAARIFYERLTTHPNSQLVFRNFYTSKREEGDEFAQIK